MLLLVFLMLGPLAAAQDLARPAAASSTRFPQKDVQIDGMRLRYIDAGKGPVLALLLGHAGRIEEYDPLVAELAGHFRVLVLDFPGSGYSQKPARRYDLSFYERTFLGFLDSLDVKRCRLAGGSQGGHLALRLAYRFPERFDRVCVWSPAGAWKARPWLAAGLRTAGGRLLFWPAMRLQSRFWFSKDYPMKDAAMARHWAYVREVFSPGFVRLYWGMAADQVAHSLFDIAPEIRQSVLILWGDHDHGAGMGPGLRELTSRLPRGRLRVVAGAGHALAVERPQETAQAVREFLR